MLPDGGPGGMRATSVERARGGGTTLSNTSQTLDEPGPGGGYAAEHECIMNNINSDSN